LAAFPYGDAPSAEGYVEALHTAFSADHLNALVLIVMIIAMHLSLILLFF